LTAGIKSKWQSAFEHFIKTGEADKAFLDYLDQDQEGQKAVEAAFVAEAQGFEALAKDLKQSQNQPAAPGDASRAGALSAGLANVLYQALQLPAEQRAELLHGTASALTESVRPEKRAAVQDLVRELRDSVTKMAGNI
jgi:hypothetical protein